MRAADGQPGLVEVAAGPQPSHDGGPSPTCATGPGIWARPHGALGWSNPWSALWAHHEQTGVTHPQPPQNPIGLNRPGISGNSSPVLGALRKLREVLMQLLPVIDMSRTRQGHPAKGWLCHSRPHTLQGILTLMTRNDSRRPGPSLCWLIAWPSSPHFTDEETEA